MKKKERIIWASALGLFIILWFLSITDFFKSGIANNDLYKNLKIFERILTLIETTYVEKPDTQKLIYGSIDGMLASLNDPYTRFIRKEGYEDLKIETEGKFGGVGFVITIRDGQLTVVSPIDGTPASRAGLQPNDKIIKINEEPTKNMTLIQAVNKLRGKPGTKVTLWIAREGVKDLIKIKIIREIIKIESVFSKEIKYKNKKIGYIKIKKFDEQTESHLENILKKYEKEKINGLILDLRNNPGGLLYSAWKVADLFLDNGMIVYTKGRIESQNKEFYASSIDYCHNVPMVVLANGGSASGSEIVIGALKDNKRAIFVGTKTFGKGVVQTVTQLDDNLAVAITTAKYYTPAGVCIHKKGIKPNIEVKFPEPSEKDIKSIEKILKNKYIEKFLKEHKDFLSLTKNKQEQLLNSFIKKLNSNGIYADYKFIRLLIKTKAFEPRQMNDVMIDLEDDLQLKKAVEVLTKRG